MKKLLVKWDGFDLDAGYECTVAYVLKVFASELFKAIVGGHPLRHKNQEIIFYDTAQAAKEAIEVALGVSDI